LLPCHRDCASDDLPKHRHTGSYRHDTYRSDSTCILICFLYITLFHRQKTVARKETKKKRKKEKYIQQQRCFSAAYYILPEKGAKYCDQHLFMSVCLSAHVSEKTICQNFTKFSAYVTCGRGSVLLLRQRNTLCTSGVVDDVMFSHDGHIQITGHNSNGVWLRRRTMRNDVIICMMLP